MNGEDGTKMVIVLMSAHIKREKKMAIGASGLKTDKSVIVANMIKVKWSGHGNTLIMKVILKKKSLLINITVL